MDASLITRIETAIRNNEDIPASIAQSVNGGDRVHLLCDEMKSLNAFLPYSQSHIRGKSAAGMFKNNLKVRILEYDKKRRSVVVSARNQLQGWLDTQEKNFISKLSMGDIILGSIASVVDFGAFVDLGGARGLIHISKMDKPLKEGDKIKVVVLSTDPISRRVSLEPVLESKTKFPKLRIKEEPQKSIDYRTLYRVMSPKKLKKELSKIENMSSESREYILTQLKKRSDWNVREMLKDGFDWWTVFKSFTHE